ncbi:MULTISPECIES: TIGR02281 family clan AA aspartic protease [unclassified Pseudomonas]|uniref:retropepsin-like aspartic protease family protein n=1 Tax=unclassified Pseudomonas TaxID=196821 RepID=UPI000BD38FF6|nr:MULTISPECIES: TIGR02281 family clan AA aspartic protease [unclassified Pseudomonas]PVZ15637.1 aspartyl protease family protein [Pseudomonas sp. URIL14HWK12:I12]PVZ25011.1 aspartyl protease family protein [Pseudomonas sp. URIL14HWK12:I10]PVZ34857.1 aspartyl protease family protein [Pseudomonas sp. URIL14HWK12:I11]SNZ09477.1 aspartyl protease family protein [Pseudomonas sp. URIL14HWK12:I9]
MSGAAPPGSRAGKLLLIAAWVAGIFLATRFFGSWEARQENPNQQVATALANGVIEVRLQANRQGHFVASGKVNGQPVTFMVDTGATQVAVPAELAAGLGLPTGAPVTLSTANGLAEGARSRVASLSLGGIELRDVSAVVMPGMGDSTVLLGMSALKRLEFNQRGGTLLLRQHPTP